MIRLLFKGFKSTYPVVWVVMLILLLMITLFLPVFPISVSAASHYLFHPGYGTATIDGVINPSEWVSADSYSATLSNGSLTGTLYVMQNASTLFLGFVVDDDELTIGYWYGLLGDTVEIFFDDNNSGSLYEVGENKVSVFPVDPWFYDAFIYNVSGSSDYDINDSGQIDGNGYVTRQGDYNHFELSFPLCSGDSHDFCLTSGSVLGLKIKYDDLYLDGDNIAANGSTYPGSGLDDLVTIEILTIYDIFLPLILR